MHSQLLFTDIVSHTSRRLLERSGYRKPLHRSGPLPYRHRGTRCPPAPSGEPGCRIRGGPARIPTDGGHIARRLEAK